MRKPGLWTKSKRDEADAVGCLVMLGGLVLLPGVLYGFGSFVVYVKGLLPASGAFQWNDVSRILNGVWQWILGRSAGGSVPPLAALFVAGLIFLLWQWTAVLLDWRPRLASLRIWMISSFYSVAVIAGIAMAVWERRDADSTEAFGAWLIVTLALSVVPGAFLAVTLPLWYLEARHRTKSARPPAPTPPA
jgi:hypothetical protein